MVLSGRLVDTTIIKKPKEQIILFTWEKHLIIILLLSSISLMEPPKGINKLVCLSIKLITNDTKLYHLPRSMDAVLKRSKRS